MISPKSVFAQLFIILSLFVTATITAQDIAGSKDHPLITRYPGSVIDYYEEQNYKPYSIATGPQTAYNHIDDWLNIEGKFTRIYYTVRGNTTLNEVYQNYLTALKQGGFVNLAEGIHPESGVSKEVGGRGFLKTFYSKNPAPTGSGIKILTGSSTSAGACYIASKLEKAGGSVFIIIGGSQYATDEKVFLVDIIEQTIMEDDLIRVNSADMMRGLKNNGKVALYGIYFDFDQAELKPESSPALEQISLLMKQNPELMLYVVGHTDMQGKFDYNMSLSEKRAMAVVNELVVKFGIAQNRLIGHGAGPLAPVATNETEDGRKLNRRVELVQR
jgi:outer membrane protein OmpA-like peptidoglycan-associated protein